MILLWSWSLGTVGITPVAAIAASSASLVLVEAEAGVEVTHVLEVWTNIST